MSYMILIIERNINIIEVFITLLHVYAYYLLCYWFMQTILNCQCILTLFLVNLGAKILTK